jgi:DNA-binding transcriptional LysR family regulator
MIMRETFQARGLAMPKISLMTFSVYLRANLLASGPYITAFPSSMLRFNTSHIPLKILPVELPVFPWPVAIVTLKNRTLSAVAQRFVDHLRAFTSSTIAEPSAAISRPHAPESCQSDSRIRAPI